jgi:magnesium transporter
MEATTPSSVIVRVYRDGTLLTDECPVAEISDHIHEKDGLVWVDLFDPEPDLLHKLALELDLHELAVEDALNAKQRPKLDDYDTHLFLAFRAVQLDGTTGELSDTELHVFVNSRWMISVRSNDHFDMSAVEKRVNRSPHLLALGASFLLYALLDAVVDDYFRASDVFDEFYDDLSDEIFEERQIPQDRQRLSFRMRRSLVQFHRTVTPLREVVSGLRRHDRDLIPDALDPYYQDVYDHVIRVTESVDATRDLASSIVETNLSLRDYRQNLVMKRVTSWAAIVAVPTLITGFYGMNVPYPGFSEAWGAWASSVLMVALSVFLYVQFKRRDWL